MKPKNKQTEHDVPQSLSTAGLGAAVIVRGQVIAWFADFNEEARDWCTYNHFGEWLVWRAKSPELVPLTEAEDAEIRKRGAELAAKLREVTEAAQRKGKGLTLAAVPLHRRVGRHLTTESEMDKLKELLTRCKCGVYLTVNEHRDYYNTAEQTLDEAKENECPPEIETDVAAIMIETDTIVRLQFYPDTPIGSYEIWHYDIDSALDAALACLTPNVD